MKIKAVIPNSGMDRETLKARESMLSRALSPGTEISVDCIPSGPTSIESNTENWVNGVGAKMFTIAGPVIVYGVSTSVIYGIILVLLQSF